MKRKQKRGNGIHLIQNKHYIPAYIRGHIHIKEERKSWVKGALNIHI